MALALHLVFRCTLRGKAWLAVVQNPDAAQLMGINVTGTIAVGLCGVERLRWRGGDVDCPLV